MTIHEDTELNPSIAMTDHDDGINKSLKFVWPEIELFLCLFHILQAVWRYLFTVASGIAREDRQDVFSKFKLCVYSDKDNLQETKNTLFNLPPLSTKCAQYFTDIWKCSSEWILPMRSNHLIHGYNTNNYCETSV